MSYWYGESRLILVQMLVTKAIDFLRFCRKKVLNLFQVKEIVLLYLT